MSLLSANAIRKVWVVQFDSVFSVYTLSINFRKLRITTSSFFYTSLCTYLTIACRTCETSRKHFILPLCKLGLNPLLPSLVGGRGNRPHSRESDEKIETRVLYSRMERILEKCGRLLALYHCAPFSRAIAGLGLHSKLVHSLAISWNVWIHGHFSDRVLCTSYENTKQTKKKQETASYTLTHEMQSLRLINHTTLVNVWASTRTTCKKERGALEVKASVFLCPLR